MKKYTKIILGGSVTFVAAIIVLAAGFQYGRAWNRALFIQPITSIETDGKVVALTFDDGPSDVRTPALLEVLEKHEVPATFFMLGRNIEAHPDIAQDVYDAGHSIGNHSYDHPRFLLKSPAFTRNQIEKTDELIQELGQEEVKYFRPPYSFSYIVLPLVLNSMGKDLVNGSYDPPAEYEKPFDGEKVAKQVLENVQPGDIIYLHDGKDADAEEFVQAVDIIITELKKEGYIFVRVDY